MKNFLIVFFVLSFQVVLGQQAPDRITLFFENASIKEVLFMIEQRTDYQIYYLEEWLEGKSVSGDYQKVPVSVILEDIFKETSLNYYFTQDHTIILTRNNIIYDQLPQGFFKRAPELAKGTEHQEDVNYNPVFYKKTDDLIQPQTETVYIGRESISSAAQRYTLSGYITNSETGDPIPNLAIYVKGKDIGGVTSGDGFYSLTLPAGENILMTSSMGSVDLEKRVIIYNNGSLNFQLHENFEDLGEVFLESNADSNVDDAVAGKDNIDIENVKNIPLILGERDVMRVAATLPGISTTGEGAAGYHVRGGKTDQNLILLDHAVLYNPAHFFGIFSAINPFTTADVTIYKGSIPAKFGGRLASVFDITTKDANVNDFAGEVSLGPVTSNVALEIPIIKEKSGLLIGGRSTYSNWILKSLDEESLKNSQASFYDLIARYNHQIGDRTTVKATGYFSHDNFSITSDSLYTYNNRLLSVNVAHRFNDRHKASFVISNSDYKFNIDYESNFDNNFRSGFRINETQGLVNMQYRHNAAHQFEYGVSGKLYNVQPGDIVPLGEGSLVDPLSLDRNRALEAAIYLSDNYQVNERLSVEAGLRYSFYAALGSGVQQIYDPGVPKSETSVIETRDYGKNEVIKTYGAPEVRASARYFIMPDLSFKASYNTTIQFIHTLSNNTTVSPTDTYQLSNLNIKPQRGNQYSLGMFKNFRNNTYELSVEGYYKNLEDILEYKTGAQLFLNDNIETEVLQGEGRTYGGEFLLKKTRGKLNGWVGYTYSRSYIKLDGLFREERINNGEYFPSNYDKPHDLSVVANYKITQRFSFSANMVYQTGRPVTFPTGKYIQDGSEYVTYSDRNKFRIPDYYRLDLSFNVEGNHKIKKFAHSFWNISVYNVLGRNNPYSVFFVTEGGEVKAYKSSIFSIPVPTITYNFRF